MKINTNTVEIVAVIAKKNIFGTNTSGLPPRSPITLSGKNINGIKNTTSKTSVISTSLFFVKNMCVSLYDVILRKYTTATTLLLYQAYLT